MTLISRIKGHNYWKTSYVRKYRANAFFFKENDFIGSSSQNVAKITEYRSSAV